MWCVNHIVGVEDNTKLIAIHWHKFCHRIVTNRIQKNNWGNYDIQEMGTDHNNYGMIEELKPIGEAYNLSQYSEYGRHCQYSWNYWHEQEGQ